MNEGSPIKEFIESKEFQHIYKNVGKAIKSPEDALLSDFFLGERNFKVHTLLKKYNEHEALCKKCLSVDRHLYECEDSGWDL